MSERHSLASEERVATVDQCWCVGDLDRFVCDDFDDNDMNECRHCGHREECHGDK